mmetsp:Transcript_11129/g.41237  ORF Transcript_11129/g.41237 Transcript_11129/m.41237 type:complete len:240 (+) Transcript_11129:184-903(+)
MAGNPGCVALSSLITSTKSSPSPCFSNPKASITAMPPVKRPSLARNPGFAKRTFRYLPSPGLSKTFPTKRSAVFVAVTNSGKPAQAPRSVVNADAIAACMVSMDVVEPGTDAVTAGDEFGTGETIISAAAGAACASMSAARRVSSAPDISPTLRMFAYRWNVGNARTDASRASDAFSALACASTPTNCTFWRTNAIAAYAGRMRWHGPQVGMLQSTTVSAPAADASSSAVRSSAAPPRT